MSILLAIFYFFYFSVVGVYIIFMPKVLFTLHYAPQEIGVIFAAAPLVRLLLPMLFAKGFRLTYKRFNMALILMLVSSFAFYSFIYDFYKLLISNIFLGMALSLILPYVEVIALEKLGKESYGKVRLFGSIGFVLVALELVRYLDTATRPVDFLLALNIITAVVAFMIARVLSKSEQREEELVNDINVFKDWKLWMALILMQVSFGAYYNFFTIYATANGISMQMTINLWVFGVLAEIIMLYSQATFLRKNLLLVLEVTLFVTALRWFLVYLFADNLYILYFSQSLHAFSFALFHSAAIAYLHHLYKNKALAQQYFSGITYGLGGFSGALLSGVIYEHYPSYIFLSSALLALSGFVFMSSFKKEMGKRPNS
jgi:PPP family 3-phenylpropionic acid transporter